MPRRMHAVMQESSALLPDRLVFEQAHLVSQHLPMRQMAKKGGSQFQGMLQHLVHAVVQRCFIWQFGGN